MKILYDLNYLLKEKHGGISTMWLELFKLIPTVDIEPIFITKDNVDNTTHKFLVQNNYFDQTVINDYDLFKSRILNRITKLSLVRSFLLLKYFKSEEIIFHSTDYINPIIPLKKMKIVVTIHDMVFWDQKTLFKKNISYWDHVWSIYHSLIIANKIIAVSESTKKSIIEKYPSVEKKISVIHHGLSKSFCNLKINYKKEKYFLFVGYRNAYKNYDMLLKAFSIFIRKYPDWMLHIVGENDSTSSEEYVKYKNLGLINNIYDHGLISQEKLIKLLQSASSLVITSRNEGFNFPLLEAMSAGCPVISSDIPVSREIGLNYPSYFSNSTFALLDALENNARLGIDLKRIKESQIHARKYSWENSMQKLLKVYESCI